MNPPREQWLARLDVCWGRLISTKDNGPLRLALRAREGVVDAAVIVVPVAVVVVVPVAVVVVVPIAVVVVVPVAVVVVIVPVAVFIKRIHLASSGSRGWMWALGHWRGAYVVVITYFTGGGVVGEVVACSDVARTWRHWVVIAPLPVLSLSVVVQWRHCLVIRHPSSVDCRPSFVGSQHLQSTPRAVAHEAGGRCASLSVRCNKYRT